jgi:hypothetical protein
MMSIFPPPKGDWLDTIIGVCLALIGGTLLLVLRLLWQVWMDEG